MYRHCERPEWIRTWPCDASRMRLVLFGGLIVSCSPRLFFRYIFQLFGIVDWSGDHVSAAGPFSQIDQAAAIAAEREVLDRARHQCPAGGAAERLCFLSGHIRLDDQCEPTIPGLSRPSHLTNDSCHQIIVMCLCDLAAIERSRHKLFMIAKIVDKQFAVDLRGMHCRPALPQQLCFF